MALVIAAAWGIRGDVTPYVGVGAELVRRGHDVKLISNPIHEPQAREAGLAFVPVGTVEDYHAFVNEPGLWDRRTHLSRGVKYLVATVEPFYHAVVNEHRPGETVLLTSRHGPWIAREKLDVPAVRFLLCPGQLSRLDPPHPGRPFPAWTDPVVRTRSGLRLLHWLKARWTWLEGLRGKSPLTGSQWVFLEELRRVRTLAGLPEYPDSEKAARADLMIGLWPAWFAAPQPDWPPETRITDFPFHPKPPPRDAPAPAPADDERERPIVFMRGSAARDQKAFFVEAVRCCVKLSRPGVLITPHADDVPSELPPGVRHTAFAPIGELFARASAVVHHGGMGTMAYAFAGGIPQVVVPIVADQFDQGYRMERLGVGSMLGEAPPSAARLARELRKLATSERVQRRCEELKERVDVDAGCSRAADQIEELIVSRQPLAAGRA